MGSQRDTGRERARYAPREAFSLRPAADAVEAHDLARTALDRPRFVVLRPAPAARPRPAPRGGGLRWAARVLVGASLAALVGVILGYCLAIGLTA